MSERPPDSRDNLRRRHDVTAALRTLRFAVEALQQGYRFDDEAGPAKLVALEKAVAALEREAPTLLANLSTP